jgi:LmbE family N-acetylglucosaminyl deacetylase
MKILYLIAHHDDEFGAWPLINQRAANNDYQCFVYLSDSGQLNEQGRRIQESRSFLSKWENHDVNLLGLNFEFRDGDLISNLHECYYELVTFIKQYGPFDSTITHAYEGGHPDHDACFMLVGALIEGNHLPDNAIQFSLYHTHQRRFPFICGAAPLISNGPFIHLDKPMTFWNWIQFVFSSRNFTSQCRVMALLVPSMFLTFLFHGFRYQNHPGRVLQDRPHQGTLMYEQRNMLSYKSFDEAIKKFTTDVL